ncbi:MAG: ABC transporter substrate-binding protein [Chloroflexaceae bacterium]|nr:ABC transporter substrate-binding protein [Chloroflexaceae bacterium]
MTKRTHGMASRAFVLLVCAGLLLAACTSAPAPAAPEEAAEAPAAEEPASADNTLRVAYASDLDPADIADQMGLTNLEESYDVEVSYLAEDSAVVAGLLRGDIDVGNLDVTAAIKAFQVGVPLTVLMPANDAVEFVLIGQPGITSVEDLPGKSVAFHAPGSGTEILPRLLVAQSDTVSDEDIEWVVLPESPNRAAAMEADRIDVTALEFADVLTLREGGKAYEIIASFYDVAPEAIATVWATTADYAAANPEVLVDMGEALSAGYATAASDKDAWMSTAQEMLDIPEERLSETYDFYSGISMFPESPLPHPGRLGSNEYLLHQCGRIRRPGSLGYGQPGCD